MAISKSEQAVYDIDSFQEILKVIKIKINILIIILQENITIFEIFKKCPEITWK